MASKKDQPCQRCSGIDLNKVFSGGYETPHLVIELGHVPQEQRKSSCGLCRWAPSKATNPSHTSSSPLRSLSRRIGTPLVIQSRPNCKTRRLRKATPKDSCVALSYVWGERDEELFNDSQIRKGKLPHTPWVVKDAMRVVTKMGYRYLWVDKYCIPQSDKKVLHEHLCQMHLIYQKALFTIVAAAGTRAWHGLPGVWMRERQEQTHTEINGRLLVSAVEPFLPTSQCKWNTRGWTYQEGLFSPRQLIFTPHQVLFHCAEGQQSEIFTEPASWRVDKPLCVRDLSVWNHIEAFSKRDLAYDHDVL
ncbi:hypothetical protein LCI18_013190 [Fusarium solani-melongenae]|uniref:Uncharacterized protein n=1 Tax=Fusarium solani subsp. cucurbitae TaxID=2747967 RepID=A0ACD3ZM10_FUSSC|nr:hypothetical protein LCI18_013190 [Fusarium solani-melongenae]